MKDERDLFYDDDISSIIDPSYEMKAMSHNCPTTTRMKTKLNAGEPVTRIPGTVIAGESEKKKRRECRKIPKMYQRPTLSKKRKGIARHEKGKGQRIYEHVY